MERLNLFDNSFENLFNKLRQREETSELPEPPNKEREKIGDLMLKRVGVHNVNKSTSLHGINRTHQLTIERHKLTY